MKPSRITVSIPEDATPEEEQRLIDQATNTEIQRIADEVKDRLVLDLQKIFK